MSFHLSFHPCLRLRTGYHCLRSNRQVQPHWPHRSSDVWLVGKLDWPTMLVQSEISSDMRRWIDCHEI